MCKVFESVDHSNMWGSIEESRKSTSQDVHPAATKVRKTERVGKNRHRELNPTGVPEQRDPLGSLPFNTVLQLALDQHMQERKEKVWGVNLGEKTKKVSSQIQHSDVPWPPGPFSSPSWEPW